MRTRSVRRACDLHGGDSCELAGEPGPVERVHEKRQWQAEVGRDVTLEFAETVDRFIREHRRGLERLAQGPRP